MNPSRHSVIIVAAGKGLRMGASAKKQYLCLDNIPILTRTLMKFDRCDQIHDIILVIPETDRDYCRAQIIDPYGFEKKIHVIEGGKERYHSVLNGLNFIRTRSVRHPESVVLIHDGVRPFVNQSLITTSIQTALTHGACIPAVRITDTVKTVLEGPVIQKTIDRDMLYRAQTPQVFNLDLILKAYDNAGKTRFVGTDDASLVEHLGHKVWVIRGSELNIKITTLEDLALGKYLLTLKSS